MNDLYRYEIRRLRLRLLRKEFPKEEYVPRGHRAARASTCCSRCRWTSGSSPREREHGGTEVPPSVRGFGRAWLISPLSRTWAVVLGNDDKRPQAGLSDDGHRLRHADDLVGEQPVEVVDAGDRRAAEADDHVARPGAGQPRPRPSSITCTTPTPRSPARLSARATRRGSVTSWPANPEHASPHATVAQERADDVPRRVDRDREADALHAEDRRSVDRR